MLKITKKQVRDHAQQVLLQECPENLSKLTKKLITATMLYLQGYQAAFDEFAENPVNESELESLLLQTALSFIMDNIISQ